MSAAVLTIGTEITSGEIVNANAAWLASRFEGAGHTVSAHLSVPDDRKAILKALKLLEKNSFLAVCGGLGPTSDDVTREIVAKWLGKPLVFSQKVWQTFQAEYARRGLPLREAHKHQCWFPKGAKLLLNPVGTALGFACNKGSCKVFVLPGPPREMEGMWNLGVAPLLKRGKAPPWRHWTLLGVPESEVAEIVEPLIQPLGLEVGYRASIPYVYLKLRGKKYSAELERQVDQAFAGRSFWRGKTDFVEELALSWKDKEILLQDGVSKGLLASRIGKFATDCRLRLETAWTDGGLSRPDGAAICGQLLPVDGDEGSVDIVWRNRDVVQKLRFTLPYKAVVASERGAKSAVEWALFKWWSWSKA